MNNERILCAAIWFDDGKVYPVQPKNIPSGYVLSGYDHDSCEASHRILCGEPDHGTITIPGFLTSTNCFVGPEEAAVTAKITEKKLTTQKLYE